MNNNKNNNYNNFYVLMFFLSMANNLLKTKISFKHSGLIFPALIDVGKKYNINIAVLTHKKLELVCNFYEISLKDILDMILTKDLDYYVQGNFLVIHDRYKIRREYILNSYISKEQWEEVEKFFEKIKEKLDIYYSINKINNTILMEGYEYILKELDVYMKNFINFLQEQIEIECRVVNYIKSKHINTGIVWRKVLKHLQTFLYNPLDIIKSLDSIDDIVDLVNINGNTRDLYNIRLLIKNQQEIVFEDKNEFHVENYQKTFVEAASPYVFMDNNLFKNKNQNNNKPFILPHHYLNETKAFKTGTYLSITPVVRSSNKVDICLKYSKSYAQQKYNHKIPEINTNCFNTVITANVNEVIIITGLKNNYLEEEDNNNILYKIFSYFFYYKKSKEKKCDMIFFIKIKKVSK